MRGVKKRFGGFAMVNDALCAVGHAYALPRFQAGLRKGSISLKKTAGTYLGEGELARHPQTRRGDDLDHSRRFRETPTMI